MPVRQTLGAETRSGKVHLHNVFLSVVYYYDRAAMRVRVLAFEWLLFSLFWGTGVSAGFMLEIPSSTLVRLEKGIFLETLQGFANKALLVGHERLFSFASPDANQRNAQVVGQKPDRVQNDPLFAERARQNGMDLIDNEHAHFELSRRDPGALP
jgi:hypothetical protein